MLCLQNTDTKQTFCNVFNNSSQPGCAESEYICVTCKRNLSNKRPKMPVQAVANGLDLLPIPDALSNLTDLERRLISLRIPFMKILSLFRYGRSLQSRWSTHKCPYNT